MLLYQFIDHNLHPQMSEKLVPLNTQRPFMSLQLDEY
jgi:hypothetical protein